MMAAQTLHDPLAALNDDGPVPRPGQLDDSRRLYDWSVSPSDEGGLAVAGYAPDGIPLVLHGVGRVNCGLSTHWCLDKQGNGWTLLSGRPEPSFLQGGRA